MKKRIIALLLSLVMLTSLLTPTALATEDQEPETTQEETKTPDQSGESENGGAKDEDQDEQTPAGDEEQTPDQDEPKNEDETKNEDDQPGEEPKQDEQTGDEQGEEPETPEEPDYESMSAEDLSALLDSLTEEEALEILNSLSDEKYSELMAYWDNLAEEDPVGESVSFTDVGPLLDQDEDQMIPGILKAALLGGIGTYSDDQDNGVRLSKSVKAVDGGYQITLEAYATGSSTTVVSTNPVDIVLVLDVSGSMDDLLSPQKVYSSELDKSKTYYYSSYSSGYREVTWNASERTWGYYINYYWYSVTPKVNANDYRNTQFYVGERKISALKSAVNGFIDNVSTTSPNSNIAIVKFAGNKTNTVGNNVYGDYSYNYSQIVKELTKVDGNKAELKSTIDSLTAAGATSADYGMQHAQAIINKAVNDKNNKNKKVVIMFTDGEPNHSNSFSDTVANDAINASKSIKAAGATVYTIGVFGEANGTPVSNVNTLTKFNKYMHFVSSNYKDATSLTNYGQATYPDGGKSYYLSATNSSDLSNIFTQISQEVGGSTVELDEKSYILDTVTDQFKIPTGTDVVKFYTEDCIGKDPTSGKETFDEKTKVEAPDVTYEIKDNTLKVTNFDFSANWCGPRDGKYSGKKLIVEFTVTEREDFLGGNDVKTNVGEADGVYDKAGNRYGEFDPPAVNVPIKSVTVEAQDKSVYLLSNVTADELKSGATIKVGDVELKLGEPNYGLADWQTEYVTITVTVKDKDGKAITEFESLADDTPFTVEVTVTPNTLEPTSTEGKTAEITTGTGAATVYVLKPTVTWTDCQRYYGESLEGFTATPVGDVTWKDSRGNTERTAGQATAPVLSYEFAIKDSKTVMPNTDVYVSVTTKINGTDVTSNMTYDWQRASFCAGDEGAPAEAQFRIHPLTCTLTISKSGWVSIDENQSFLFEYQRTGGNPVGTAIEGVVTVQGNGSVQITGLPIGTYQVSEDKNWSWRYTPETESQSATLTTVASAAALSFANSRTKNIYWLNGCSWAVNNWASGKKKTDKNPNGETN